MTSIRRDSAGHNERDRLDEVLDRLEGVRQENGGFKALCPTHDDRNPSLGIGVGNDGRVLFRCFAGCSQDDVLSALDLEWSDLFPKQNGGNGKKPSRSWEIRDEHGEVQAIHERFDRPGGKKDCFWKLPGGTLKQGLKGRKLPTLPLYRSELVKDWSKDSLVILVEGEKDADALAEVHEKTLGTVTGAGQVPSEEVLELLRGQTVILWPDADEDGWKHMQRIASRLHGIASEIRVFSWDNPPEGIKGAGAADHPAVKEGDPDKLYRQWAKAPVWEPPAEPDEDEQEQPVGLQGRVKLGELLRGGIEPTPQLIDGLLYEGRVHSIASGPGTGKTLIALHTSIQVMDKGLPVLYLDAENGPKIIAERLQEMGADPDVLDRLFHYYPADLTLAPESRAELWSTVEETDPALVVFDSLADFLGMNGLEENNNTDCTRWFTGTTQPLKDRGVASLLLDHVPKGGKGPRGAGAKGAKIDVQYELDVSQVFDRERTGEIELEITKDREGWLPKIARFSIGGGVFARSHGTIEERDPHTRMSVSASKVYDALRKAGTEGARWSDLEWACGGSKGTVQRGLKELERYNFLEKRGGRYYLKDAIPQNPISITDSGSTARYQSSTAVPRGTGTSESSIPGTTPYRVVPGGTTDTPDSERDYDRMVRERIESLEDEEL